jgi:TPR repeat protein
VPRDYSKAREWYEKAAAAGNGQAMASIGWLYRDGLGAARDYAMARHWFEKSVAARHGAGMHGLGVLHEAGQGVPKDLAKARDWFEKSAATGYDFGMNALGWLYQTAPVADYAKAREWYEKAVLTSNRLALRNLAVLLDQGQGGPSDPARAARLLLEAAKLNNAAAIEDLRGSMAKWSAKTRDELKRELAGRGHYKGPLNDAWDKDARAAVDKFLTTGG